MEKKSRKKSPLITILMIILIAVVSISVIICISMYFLKTANMEDMESQQEGNEQKINREILFKIDDKYIDSQGYITSKSDDTAIELEGITITENQERLDTDSLMLMANLIKLRDILKSNELLNKVNKIDVSNLEDIIVYMDSEYKVIYIGNFEKLHSKILCVNPIIKQEKGISGEIFVRDTEKVFFRKKVY